MDGNHAEVVAAFLRAGCTVQRISAAGCPDLLVGHKGQNILVEVKNHDGELNPIQRAWHATWRGSKPYVIWEASNVPALLRDAAKEWDE